MSYGGSGELTQSDGSGELTQSDECYERYSTRPTRPHQKQLKSVVRGTSLPDRSPEGGAVKVSRAFACVYLQDGCSFWDQVTTKELGYIYDA